MNYFYGNIYKYLIVALFGFECLYLLHYFMFCGFFDSFLIITTEWIQ